jgi:hypothetical protein
MNPTTARPASRNRRRRRVFAAACVAVALSAGLGVTLWLDQQVPPPNADAGRLARYMAGPEFAALPDAEKAPYLGAFQLASDRGELTPEQQSGVIRNVTNPNGKNPIRQYFSLPAGEREKFLDDVIDRVLKAEKDLKRPPPPDKQGETPIRFDGGRLADSIPPEERARMGQFLQDLHDRRAARGVPDDGKFLFDRGD